MKLEGARIGWSMLTVAHRLQTIMDYDRVVGMAGMAPSIGANFRERLKIIVFSF